MTHANIIDLNADVIDVRDIIERIEELEAELMPDGEHGESGENLRSTFNRDPAMADEWAELDALLSIMQEMAGYGGDEKWRGEWYPVTLIRESHFVDYVQEMLEDCGEIPANLPHYIHIDWESTARDVKVDYSEVTLDGVSYLYR